MSLYKEGRLPEKLGWTSKAWKDFSRNLKRNSD